MSSSAKSKSNSNGGSTKTEVKPSPWSTPRKSEYGEGFIEVKEIEEEEVLVVREMGDGEPSPEDEEESRIVVNNVVQEERSVMEINRKYDDKTRRERSKARKTKTKGGGGGANIREKSESVSPQRRVVRSKNEVDLIDNDDDERSKQSPKKRQSYRRSRRQKRQQQQGHSSTGRGRGEGASAEVSEAASFASPVKSNSRVKTKAPTGGVVGNSYYGSNSNNSRAEAEELLLYEPPGQEVKTERNEDKVRAIGKIN